MIPNNTRISRITAAAGTRLADAYSSSNVILPPREKKFTTRRPSSFTRYCSVRLSPIAEYSSLLPPVGVWTVSQFQCGWSSSQTSYWSSPW